MADGPFVVLLSQDGANQATHGWSVREDAHDIGATSDLLVETLQGVVGPDLLPVGDREAGEGQDIGSSLVHLRGLEPAGRSADLFIDPPKMGGP